MKNKKLKEAIIHAQGYVCSECGIDSWNEKSITLELDHIDGDNLNNDPTNLRLLCPNCHSQTDTFRGRNIPKLRVTDEMLLDALSTTDNIRKALLKVGLSPKGGNYVRASRLLNLSYEKNMQKTNSQYGTVWICKNDQNKKIKKEMLEEYLEVGWIRGRKPTWSIHSQKGRYWVTNGLISKMVYETPEGWWKGRC